MRKLSYLVLVLALVLPLAVPFGVAVAQDDPVVARLKEYDANLPAGYGMITVEDLNIALIENPDIVLVDVRQPEEYAEGHIEGAFNIPLKELAQNLDALPNLDASIVVYCGTGFRSAIGMAALQIIGYTDVKSMKGGFGAWKAAEYPVSTEAVEPERGEAPDVDGDVVNAVDAGLQLIPPGWGAVKAEDLNIEMIENPPEMLIDVRTDAEWEQGYIPGAVHMPLESFTDYLDQLPEAKDTNIVVYCAGGHRGNMVATMMRTLGYSNVRNLAGGFKAWANAGYEIEGAPEGEPAAAGEFDAAALFADYLASLPASFNAVFPNKVAEYLDEHPDAVIVDVRTPEEYEQGHLAGAINIPLTELTDHLDMLPNLDADMLVYCGTGHRSGMATMAFNLLGYQNAVSAFGGLKAFGENFELTTDVPEVAAGEAPAIDENVFALVDGYIKSIQPGYFVIKAEDLNIALIENPPFVIDVRTNNEWEKGHIQGAVHWPLREFMNHMDEWPEPDTPIVIYSLNNHRSVMAMMIMQMMGYSAVRSLGGGVQAWQKMEYPLVTD